MLEIKLYKSPRKALRILALTIPFVVGGIWMITSKDIESGDRVVGWLCTCFFGLGLPIGLFQLLDKRPQIIMNETGIWDRTTNQDVINWNLIQDAYTLEIYKQQFICLVLDEKFEMKKSQHKWAAAINEGIGAQKVNLLLSQIKIDPEKLALFIISMSTPGADRKALLAEAQKEW